MELVSLEALVVHSDGNSEELTDLGKHLANLPVDARLGKLILLGSAFGPEVGFAVDIRFVVMRIHACMLACLHVDAFVHVHVHV